MARIYCDTNVYLDHLLERKNEYGRDISRPAARVFEKVIDCKFEIIVSDWVKKELGRKIKDAGEKMLFALLSKKTVKIKKENIDIQKAKKLSPDHFQDALHAVLANKSNSKFLVTRNIEHFRKFVDLCEPRLPETI